MPSWDEYTTERLRSETTTVPERGSWRRKVALSLQDVLSGNVPTGVSITTVEKDVNGHLLVSLSDGVVIDAGYVIGPKGDTGDAGQDGRGIVSVGINASKELVIDLSDGTVVNVGTVKGDAGQDGKGISSINFDAFNHLIVTYTDNSTTDLGNINGQDGEDGFTPDHIWNGSTLTFQNPDGGWGTPVNLLGPVGPKGEKGDVGPRGPSGSDATIPFTISSNIKRIGQANSLSVPFGSGLSGAVRTTVDCPGVKAGDVVMYSLASNSSLPSAANITGAWSLADNRLTIGLVATGILNISVGTININVVWFGP